MCPSLARFALPVIVYHFTASIALSGNLVPVSGTELVDRDELTLIDQTFLQIHSILQWERGLG